MPGEAKKKLLWRDDTGGLSQKGFDLLACLAERGEKQSQRQLAGELKISLGSVNRLLRELMAAGLVRDGLLTADGLKALEPYRVKRAVFVAAGFGSRLAPITLNTPKPLVRVHGKRLIDGLLDAVLAAGIEDIVIVRGYLAEQFDQLLYKYPMIRFIENPYYNESNNISSAMCARHLLENAYVLEADWLLYKPSIIKKYQYASNFLGFKVERSDDWCFSVKNGIITEQKIGGLDCYEMVGISYWNGGDGRRLAGHIEKVYEMPGGKERYWDQVPLVVFKDEYQVRLRECQRGDVIEIDTFRELKAMDKAYDI